MIKVELQTALERIALTGRGGSSLTHGALQRFNCDSKQVGPGPSTGHNTLENSSPSTLKPPRWAAAMIIWNSFRPSLRWGTHFAAISVLSNLSLRIRCFKSYKNSDRWLPLHLWFVHLFQPCTQLFHNFQCYCRSWPFRHLSQMFCPLAEFWPIFLRFHMKTWPWGSVKVRWISDGNFLSRNKNLMMVLISVFEKVWCNSSAPIMS